MQTAFVLLLLALLGSIVLCGDPSCNRAYAGGGRVLSFKQTKKLWKRDHRKMRAEQKKKEEAVKTQRYMMEQQLISPEEYIGDGGGYYGGGPVATEVHQLAPIYVPEIDIGPRSWNNVEPKFFQSTEDKAALSCQLDCMSQVGGRPAFTGCATRYYKYGALVTQGCFSLSVIGDEQASLAHDICVNYNGCYGALAVFTRDGLQTTTGNNAFYTPPELPEGATIKNGPRKYNMEYLEYENMV